MTGPGQWVGSMVLDLGEWVTLQQGRRFKRDHQGWVLRSVTDTSAAARRRMR